MKTVQKPPFFIVGCPRSGTTLLQLLISSHPNIAIPPESHIFSRFASIFDSYGDLQDDTNLKIFVKDILHDYHIRDWELGIPEDEFVSRLKDRSVKGVISLLMELYCRNHKNQRWGDKTPQHTLYLDEIQKLFPEALFIHLVRDGRDVAVSSSRIFVGPPSIYGIAKEWRRYVFAFEKFKELLPKKSYIEIKYEDLIRSTELNINRIFRFLDEEPIKIKNSLPNTVQKNYYLNTDAHMLSLAEPITDKKIGLFRKHFTQRQIDIFEAIAGDALQIHGYKLFSTEHPDINVYEKLQFLFMDNFYRYYRKYCRPRNIDKSWFLLRREAQFHYRKSIRNFSLRKTIKN